MLELTAANAEAVLRDRGWVEIGAIHQTASDPSTLDGYRWMDAGAAA